MNKDSTAFKRVQLVCRDPAKTELASKYSVATLAASRQCGYEGSGSTYCFTTASRYRYKYPAHTGVANQEVL